jgi:hypothetical protein
MPSKSKWLDRTQPQTLYMATVLLYLNAALAIFSALVYHSAGGLIGLVFIVGEVLGGRFRRGLRTFRGVPRRSALVNHAAKP